MANTFPLIDVNKKIEIKPGKIFINRTYKYLSPSLKLYGEEFITKMRMLYCLGVGIQDYGFNKTPDSRKFENKIYYLMDVNGEYAFGKYSSIEKNKIDFFRVISWLRGQEYYVTDYPFDSGKNGNQHMIVLKLPMDLIHKFLTGSYTEMYDNPTIEKIIPKTTKILRDEVLNPIFAVLTKNPDYLPTYVEQLNNDYHTSLNAEDVKHHTQFDIPPLPKNEIFRW